MPKHLQDLTSKLRDLHAEKQRILKEIEDEQQRLEPAKEIQKIKVPQDVLLRALNKLLRTEQGLVVKDPLLLITLNDATLVVDADRQNMVLISRSEWARLQHQSPQFGAGRPRVGGGDA